MSSTDPEKGNPDETKPLKVTEEEALPLPSCHDDAVDIVKLGIPIFVAMVSWVGMKTTDTALLGHVSADALAAAALSDLWTMCTGVLLQGRVLGILVGAAIGAGNHKLAGIYLQVSYFVISCLAIFVVIAWVLTGPVWKWFGSDPDIADDAGYYSIILSLGIPGVILFSQLSQFFSAQSILNPEVNTSLISLIANLVLGMIFVLGIPIPNFDGFGFYACPIVTTIVVYFQIIFFYTVYIRIQRLHEPCWNGWSWSDITRQRIITFCELYLPASFSMASDFWRVAVIGAVAAKLGKQEVAVFNTSYRIMWIVLIIVNALSGASAIKMSLRLGSLDHVGAKQAGYVGVAMSIIILVIISSFVAVFTRAFGLIFTSDPEFLDLFEQARWPFAVTLFLMSASVAIEKLPYSMGRTQEVFWYGLVASWGAQVPAVILLTTMWRNDLTGLFSGMALGYFVLVILYSILAFTSDWKKYAELARARSEA